MHQGVESNDSRYMKYEASFLLCGEISETGYHTETHIDAWE